MDEGPVRTPVAAEFDGRVARRLEPGSERGEMIVSTHEDCAVSASLLQALKPEAFTFFEEGFTNGVSFSSRGLTKEMLSIGAAGSGPDGAGVRMVLSKKLFVELFGEKVHVERNSLVRQVIFKSLKPCSPLRPTAGVYVLDSVIHAYEEHCALTATHDNDFSDSTPLRQSEAKKTGG